MMKDRVEGSRKESDVEGLNFLNDIKVYAHESLE